VEQLGKENLIYFNLGDHPVIASVAPDSAPLAQDVELLWNMDKMHLFDTSSGRVIK
jgi:hypothetical protein